MNDIIEHNNRILRKFLKRVGINSQRVIEEEIEKQNKGGIIQTPFRQYNLVLSANIFCSSI